MNYCLGGSALGSLENGICCILPESLESPPFYTGEPMLSQWVQPPLDVIDGEICDVISYRPGALIFSKHAMDVTLPFIKNEVEFLPISLKGMGELFVLNVVNVIDCLDMGKSEVRYHADGQTVRTIRDYKFYENMLDGVCLFKIPQSAGGEILATEKFKCIMDELNLKGFKAYPLFGQEKRKGVGDI